MSYDLSLEELEEYIGTNPIPDDFYLFWKDRMRESEETPLRYVVRESEIQGYMTCDFYDLWFTGVRGERLYAKYVRPNRNEKVPIVLQFHGYPGSSRSWFEQASFAGMGYAVIAMDCPGQGGRSSDCGGYEGTTVSGHIIEGMDGEVKDLYYVRLYQNIAVLMRIVQELEGLDLNRIYVNGASQGGGLACVCAALHPGIVKKAILLYPFLSDFERVFDLKKDEIAYEGLRYYARWFDPMGKKRKEMFTKLGYIDVHNFASMIRSEVLFGCSLADEICPPSTQFAVYNRLICKKQKRYYYDYGHEEISVFDDQILDFLQEERS